MFNFELGFNVSELWFSVTAVEKYGYLCIPACMCTCTYMCVCVYIYIYIYIIHMYTHTHIHMYTLASSSDKDDDGMTDDVESGSDILCFVS